MIIIIVQIVMIVIVVMVLELRVGNIKLPRQSWNKAAAPSTSNWAHTHHIISISIIISVSIITVFIISIVL